MYDVILLNSTVVTINKSILSSYIASNKHKIIGYRKIKDKDQSKKIKKMNKKKKAKYESS